MGFFPSSLPRRDHEDRLFESEGSESEPLGGIFRGILLAMYECHILTMGFIMIYNHIKMAICFKMQYKKKALMIGMQYALIKNGI